MTKKSLKIDLQNLPPCVAEFIKLVIKKMRYRRKVRQDVMAELAAHFEDELKDCKTDEEKQQKAQQLIDEFGNAKLLGVLLRRAKKRCRPLWRTVVARTFQTIGVLILCFVIYLVWFFSGKPVITVDYIAELNRITRPVADDNLNAAPIYNKAAELYVKEPNEISRFLGSRYRQTPSELMPIVRQWLSENKEALELIIAGTQKPYYWQKYATKGNTSELMEVMMPNLASFRRCAYALRWRAWLSAQDNRYNDAFSDMLACYRLGQHLKGDKLLIDQLVGIAIEALSVQTIRAIISEHKIDSPTLTTLQRDLEQIAANENFVISIKTERLFMYDEIQRCFTEDRLGGGHLYLPRFKKLTMMTASSSNDSKSQFDSFCKDLLYLLNSARFLFTHPNKQETLKSANEFYDYFEQLAVKTAAQIQAESEAIDNKVEELLSKYVFINTLAPALGRVIEISNRLPVDINSTLTIIALLRYAQDKGDYPNNLGELITAGYLKEIPLDTFSNKPLVYRKTDDGFTLYSVGPNFIDDGGESGKDKKGKAKLWADNGDTVFWPMQRN